MMVLLQAVGEVLQGKGLAGYSHSQSLLHFHILLEGPQLGLLEGQRNLQLLKEEIIGSKMCVCVCFVCVCVCFVVCVCVCVCVCV